MSQPVNLVSTGKTTAPAIPAKKSSESLIYTIVDELVTIVDSYTEMQANATQQDAEQSDLQYEESQEEANISAGLSQSIHASENRGSSIATTCGKA